MTDPTSLRVLARGNHKLGYWGIIVVGYFTATFTWECGHRHPTTAEARDCIRRYVWRMLDETAPSGVVPS